MPSSSQHSESTGFADLGLDPRMVAALAELDYSTPTPIQKAAIPVVLGGQDLIGQAATGTGKTAAFSLPMLHRIAAEKAGRSRSRAPMGMVLAPTRELAMQVAEAAQKYGKVLGLKVLPIYGGQGYGEQLRGLSQGVDVVVATPGRALDHVRRGTLDLSQVKTIVLDEADEMLDMGFAEDIEAVLSALPAERQVLLFSATMPPRIASMAKRHQKDPVHIAIKPEKLAQGAAPKVRETAYVVTRPQKLRAIQRILEVEGPNSAIIFCRTRENVDELTEGLVAGGQSAEALHGGMSQVQRERVVRRLKEGKTQLVIATDVAARGLDIDTLSHVINVDVPGQVETYVHRIGRVGRAGREGVAITLVEPRDHRLFKLIEKTTGRPIIVAKVPTVAELMTRRFVSTGAALKAAVGKGDLEPYAAVLEDLAGDCDMVELTLAAIKLVHESMHKSQDDNGDISAPKLPSERSGDRSFGDSRYGSKSRRDRGGDPGPQGDHARGARPGRAAPARRMGGERSANGDVVCLKVNVGRAVGVRPGDLVGAITGEAGVPGRAIGAIEITDHHSLVEVPGSMASDILAALGRARIKGHKINAQRLGAQARY
jgi:ATP-dependent RNA helicase DeaD